MVVEVGVVCCGGGCCGGGCCGGGEVGVFGFCAKTTETEKAKIANKIVGRIILYHLFKDKELFLKTKDITIRPEFTDYLPTRDLMVK